MIEYNIGIMGAGYIAGVIAKVLKDMNGFCPYAIASRDEEKAKKFAEEYEIEKAYGSYEAMLEDPEVELVYIATVNSNHVELAKKCIDAGKPVFVEKPISYNAKTAAELLKYATEKGVFCGEAMWLRYNPLMNLVVDNLRKNIIGDVRSITANIGIITTTGVDAYSSIYMRYPQGRSAYITVSMTTSLDKRCIIYGTHGRIEIDNVNNPTLVTVYGSDGKSRGEMKPADDAKTGYEYEFKAARKAAIAGNQETEELSIKDTIEIYRFIDAIRYTWNLPFPLPEEPEKKPMTVENLNPNTKNA